MRRNAILSGLAVFALVAVVFSPAWGQFPIRKGSFPGGGMSFSGGGNSDPNRMFDMIARGRPYFLVTETQRLREPLTQFLKERGISNGQVTRELFAQYNEQQMKAISGATGGAFKPGGFAAPGGFAVPGGGFTPPGGGMFSASPSGLTPGFDPGQRRGGSQFDSMTRWADDEFNRRDSNGDAVLNGDEMPDAIKNDLVRWDNNHDNLIDRDEYRGFFLARLQAGGDGRGGMANPVTIILEEEFDKRPTVLRAGKLPKDLKWFEELDLDSDGQVAMYEWRKGGKNMDDYANYDRNEDGFITPEEALRMTVARNHAGDDEGDGERSGRSGNSFMSRGGKGDNRGNSEDRAKMFEEIRAKMSQGGNPFGPGGSFFKKKKGG